MNRQEVANELNYLMAFLCDKDTPLDEERAQLIEDGVDVDSFVDRIKETVRKEAQNHWRKHIEQEKKPGNEKFTAMKTALINWPIEKLQAILVAAREGQYGPVGQTVAIACRNGTSDALSLEELQSLVADILKASNVDSPDKL
jgi:hypothetical protein